MRELPVTKSIGIFCPSCKRVNREHRQRERIDPRDMGDGDVANRVKNLWRTDGQTQSRVSRTGAGNSSSSNFPGEESVNGARRFRLERIARFERFLKTICLMDTSPPPLSPPLHAFLKLRMTRVTD